MVVWFCYFDSCSRCLGVLLQKVDDRIYVCDKIDWMYKQANIAIPANRLGLAKAMGLVVQALKLSNVPSILLDNNLCCMAFQVAASHLDTVLEKLKNILDSVGKSIFQRFAKKTLHIHTNR